MSIKLMSVIWDRPDLDPYERLVLLSLADHANDEGQCFPSISRLCQRTGMKERGVQTVIRRTVRSIETGQGRSRPRESSYGPAKWPRQSDGGQTVDRVRPGFSYASARHPGCGVRRQRLRLRQPEPTGSLRRARCKARSWLGHRAEGPGG